MRMNWRPLLLTLALATTATPGFADDLEELRKLRDTTINLVNALVEQGVLTRAKADEIIAQAQQSATKPGAATPAPASPAATGASPPVVRVPYVPESVKEEIRDEVKGEVLAQAKNERWGQPGAFPDWLQHFAWDGDIRLRGEADRFPNDGTPNASVAELQAFGVNIANSTQSTDRYRVRAPKTKRSGPMSPARRSVSTVHSCSTGPSIGSRSPAAASAIPSSRRRP
jgi:hypothetical protein